MTLVAGLLAAADDLEGMAILTEYSSAHHRRDGQILEAEVDARAAQAIRAAAKLLRKRASAERTDRAQLCIGCRARLEGK